MDSSTLAPASFSALASCLALPRPSLDSYRLHPCRRAWSAFPPSLAVTPRDAAETGVLLWFDVNRGKRPFVLHHAAIPALAGPRTPGLALHANHSYGYAWRSSAAPSRTRPQRDARILRTICGLANCCKSLRRRNTALKSAQNAGPGSGKLRVHCAFSPTTVLLKSLD